MKIELNKVEQGILIDLLFNRINTIEKELKASTNKLQKSRLNKELKNTLKTLKKFEIK